MNKIVYITENHNEIKAMMIKHMGRRQLEEDACTNGTNLAEIGLSPYDKQADTSCFPRDF